MQGYVRPASCVFSLGLAVFGIAACSSSKAPEANASNNVTSAPAAQTDVVQHHNSGTRDGLYVDNTFTRDRIANLHRDTSFNGALTGDVYAQPLWVKNGPGGREAFIVATEANHVTALDASGNVVWDKTFGDPATSGLPCGNVRPLGITGTPYIDTASRTIYFDAMTQGSPVKHKIYAISLDDGSTKPGWPADFDTLMNGTGKSPNHNQRGALTMVNGTLYVPYGGHYGDCDPYRGTVVSIPTNNPAGAKFWSTNAKRGGIWAVGGLCSDGEAVYGATGNTGGVSGAWGGGEAVVRLKGMSNFSAQDQDFFAPTNWQALDDSDADIGGANPILVDMPGAPVPHLVLAFGKDANMYVMNRDDMGGLGGQVATLKVASGALLGAGAAYKTANGNQYVVFRSSYGHGVNCPAGTGAGNIGAVQILPENPPRLKMAWCVEEKNLGGPIVTSTDGTQNAIVWDANDHLWGYDGDTGAKVFAGGAAGDALEARMQYFNSPIVAGGRIAVALKGKLAVYK